MRKSSLLMFLMVGLVAIPASAGDDEEGGWFIAIEATSLQPTGGLEDYALLDPDDSNSQPQGTIQSVDYDYEMAPRIHFGHTAGNGGRWSFSWWEYDEDTTDSVSATSPSNLWDILYHADESFDDYEGTADALGAYEASLMDLTYSRPLTSSDRFHTRWSIGVRRAELDHGLAVLYDDTFSVETVLLASEAEGTGFSGGLNGMYMLNDKWFVTGGTTYSFMVGELESLTFQEDSVDGIDADITAERDANFSIFEAKCAIAWHPTNSLYLWAGYEFSQWNNVVERNLFPDDVNEGFIQNDISSVTWDGFTFGAAFTF